MIIKNKQMNNKITNTTTKLCDSKNNNKNYKNIKNNHNDNNSNIKIVK